jgi:small subunit ribosomal protein S9
MANKYYEGVGRRKTSTCRVRIFKGNGKININNKDYSKYFADFEDKDFIILSPLEKVDEKDKFDISVLVKGGGKRSQLEAIQLGLARALVKYDKNYKTTLKAEGYLTRDPRMKERKKPGKKSARRGAQWGKR